ncbi:hypothetical protein [Streptococcus hillyeri]|uniref:Uncharacterized protein n=1 Tax=Streptococcus hillyeri TaxID=2282420 RepID=A0A3L9E0B2_9STRE|nr:hypothetical protein [Streptococcus hillyeri]RLY04852.1 hypothetical protein EAF07_02370 [Streptococcus hillyeri]
MKNTMQAFANLILGIVFIGLGFWMRSDILLWEQTGGTRRLNAIIYAVYNIAGANGVLALLILVSLIFFYTAYQKFTKKA